MKINAKLKNILILLCVAVLGFTVSRLNDSYRLAKIMDKSVEFGCEVVDVEATTEFGVKAGFLCPDGSVVLVL